MKSEHHQAETQQDLQAVCDAFAKWRRSRRKREPIPEELWRAAVDLCASYPIFRIARALRLNHARLKQRVQQRAGKNTSFEFVEVKAPPLLSLSPCVVQLRSPAGFELKIEMDAAAACGLAPIISCFVSQGR